MAYGIDTAVGVEWFGELLEGDKVVEHYDSMSDEYDHQRPLRGLLIWIGEASDLFDETDLHETLELLIHTLPEDLPDHLKVVGEIVSNLRAAAEHG